MLRIFINTKNILKNINERETTLTAKLLDAKPFSFPLESICASLDATRLTFDQEQGMTYIDFFLDSIPKNYVGKIVTFYSNIQTFPEKENSKTSQYWTQTLSTGIEKIRSARIIPLR